MKKTSKLLALFLVLSLVFSLLCLPVSAAKNAPQGKTATVVFTFEDVAGVSGQISYSNKDIFSAVTARVVDTTSEGDVSENAFMLYSDDTTTRNLSFILTLKVDSKAKVNDTCIITLTYDVSDENGNLIKEDQILTETVKIVEDSATNVDYSFLNEQIALADVLVEKDFTAASWAPFESALVAAKGAKTSKNQVVVDTAAKTLESARLALVKLDYSALIAALAKADAYYTTDDVTAAVGQFVEAIMNGNAILANGGSQEDINAAAAQILDLLEALKEALSEVGETKIVYVDKVVEVEVPGETVTEIVEVEVEVQNNLFLVLFIITLILLIAAIVVLVVIFIKKKNTEKDTTPLVDYRIEDDDK